MIAKDSIGFSISENYLTCHLKVEKRISIMDLYDIFKVLGMMRICSWQEFSIFAKPRVFTSDEYLSMVYSKKELELKLLNRNIVEKHINEARKENPDSPIWIEVISIKFKEEQKDLEAKIKGAMKKMRDDYDYIPNLWTFKFELSNGEYVTDETIIDPSTFHIEVRHNVTLEDLFHGYLTEHPAQLYKLFNASIEWQMESDYAMVPEESEEEFDSGEYDDEFDDADDY